MEGEADDQDQQDCESPPDRVKTTANEVTAASSIIAAEATGGPPGSDVTPAGHTGAMVVLDIDRAPVEPGGHLPSNGSEAGGARPAGEEPRILRSLPAAPDTWKPLAGAALLDRLRITGRPRPKADPELTAKLRHDLEQGLSTGPGGLRVGVK